MALTIVEGLEAAEIVDSLLRTENPLSNGGKWHKPSFDTVIGQCSASEGWKPNTAFTTGSDGARFDTEAFKQKVEGKKYAYAIAEMRMQSNQTAERWFGLWALMHISEMRGYRFRAEMTSLNTYKLYLERFLGSPESPLATVSGFSANTQVGAVGLFAIVIGEGNIYGYVKKSGEGKVFEKVIEAKDSSLTEGYGDIEARGNFVRMRNFKSGSFVLEEAGAKVNVKTPTGIKSVKRWVKTPGGLVNV